MSKQLRELMLLRHAKSDWKEPDLQDIDRPISDKGKKSACKISNWLSQNNALPDLVWVSPAKRAQQTLKRLNLPKDIPVETQELLYLADTDQLKALLSKIPDQFGRVMFIGHNPGFEKLMRQLMATDDPTKPELFPTATLAHFILPNQWNDLSIGDAKLINFIRPKDITLASCKEV
ncbi:histidine phosphatase family protein [Hydrogenovibrio sp. 3SP14C1]|uniref:SixA phosphatase family protein n=1 Tax=Hydrogenovibrio sp. 3SP14C1 TaxID=3038774 RepID=UPI002417308C|nr:histidine phosphatase family protein [Hydrogenovibrio sp. 3SP14C1]MDG4812608.1 histidine phosphatase family protein [Hydrogenovibrio sp. 3SP14C1]